MVFGTSGVFGQSDTQKFSSVQPLFYTAFRERHISVGIMRRKLWEFLDLQQGTDSVYEYIKKCNYLAQYGTHHVDTDDKKAELFRRGLSLPL
jgi:hypothetical protein